MSPHRFDAARLGKLNDVARLDDLVPDLMWKAFGVPDARLVIELGAGTGMFAREFAAMMKPGGRLFAVDSSPEMVRWMTQHFVGGTDVEIVPILADAAELPLDAGSADLVYTVNVYHELDDPLAVLKEAWRVLRPGARIAIVDWKKEATPKGPPIEHRSDLDAMTGALESAEFTSVTSHPVLRYHNVLTATRP